MRPMCVRHSHWLPLLVAIHIGELGKPFARAPPTGASTMFTCRPVLWRPILLIKTKALAFLQFKRKNSDELMRESEKLPHLSSARLKTWRKGDETEVDEKVLESAGTQSTEILKCSN